MMNREGRPPAPTSTALDAGDAVRTTTGNRGLDIVEPLLFEVGGLEKCGVDLDLPEAPLNRLGDMERTGEIGLPGLSEPEAMRHYVRLSRRNYAIDMGVYP